MSRYSLVNKMSADQKIVFEALKSNASTQLDHTPRFKYFTLHGSQHIDNLLLLAELLGECGLRLAGDEAYMLGCSICLHDLGMIIPLRDFEDNQIFGRPQPADPANLEMQIREMHHELIEEYIDKHFDFFTSLGLSNSDCAIIRDISRCHRVENLDEYSGYARSIGALLRLIDELDIYPSRAPSAVLADHYEEWDSTSCWHWFKHNISEDWRLGHNIEVQNQGKSTSIKMKLAVHPTTESAIPYWLTQIKRPILRVLFDEGAARIISECWGINISLEASSHLSSTSAHTEPWISIEQKALSSGRKVILVIDDEARKLEDLFLPLMQSYHVVFSSNASDAIDKLAATDIDLAIVDLQIGSGFIWSPEDTHDYKLTGVLLCQEVFKRFPKTKVGILTGSRHDISLVKDLTGLEFLLRKPIDPQEFEREVCRVLA